MNNRLYKTGVGVHCFFEVGTSKYCHMLRLPPRLCVQGEKERFGCGHISSSAESAHFPELLPKGCEVRRARGGGSLGGQQIWEW